MNTTIQTSLMPTATIRTHRGPRHSGSVSWTGNRVILLLNMARLDSNKPMNFFFKLLLSGHFITEKELMQLESSPTF